MTHRKRIQAIKEGETLKRPAFSAWGHVLNANDLDARRFARATIDLQNQNDFDFIKVMSNPYYMIEDMGLKLIRPANFRIPTGRDSHHLPIRTPSDWDSICFPDPDQGSLAREKEAIRRIVDAYRGDTPVLATIFTPVTWIQYLAVPESELDRAYAQTGSCLPALERYLVEQEPRILPALEHFQELNLQYMDDLLAIGVDGFFYAVEYSDDVWGEGNFEHFVKTYDLQALAHVSGRSFFNLLHVCGDHRIRLDRLADYPVDAVNWYDRGESNPSLAQAAQSLKQIPVGGLDHRCILRGTDPEAIRKQVRSQIRDSLQETGGRLILSGGCAWDPADAERFAIIREVLNDL